jgi:hypothetical protein
MRPFACSHCQQNVFFENDHCGHCGAQLGFVPAEQRLMAFGPLPEDGNAAWPRLDQQQPGAPALRPCANRLQYATCNWMLDAGDQHLLCRGCRLNRTIPDLSRPGNLARWSHFEQAKRRWLYTLLQLGLAPDPKAADNDVQGLVVDIMGWQPGAEPVLTGHADGVITLNLDEADDVHREMARASFGEPWRTLVAHFRHEGAHYLHLRWIHGNPAAEALFRETFGDERADYAQALARYHAQGPVAGWEQQHVSAYASAHPHEDWAETCAHWLLALDAIETAGAWGLTLDSAAASASPAASMQASGAQQPMAPEQMLLTQWLPVAQFLNAMNRSLGLPDSYPFLLPPRVLQKMGVVARLLAMAAGHEPAPMQPMVQAQSQPLAPSQWQSQLRPQMSSQLPAQPLAAAGEV